VSIARHALVREAARLYAPLMTLFAASLLLEHAPAGGFSAGVAFSLVLALYALVFGAEAARRAAPPWVMRALLCAGLLVAIVSLATPGLPLASRVSDAGTFVAASAGVSLLLVTLMGRAATLRAEER
jgi:multisubunit Na+/H+ antiporter MnhB subunit